MKGGGPVLQQKNTGMQQERSRADEPGQCGSGRAGTAKDTAGSGTQRNPASQKQ